MIKGKRALYIALVLCVVLVSAASAVTFNWKISGTMPDDRDVSDLAGDAGYLVTSDSQKVVFLANRNSADVEDLFVVPVKGGAVIQLNPPLISGGTFKDFKITPDGTRVIYLADMFEDELVELFSVPITGGASIKINGPLNGDVKDFIISPDSQTVIFSFTNYAGDTKKLFKALAAGGEEPISIVGDPLDINAIILDYDISDDSNWVVFRAKPNDYADPHLYSIDLHAANNLVDIGETAGIDTFKIAPLSQYVVYTSANKLYSIGISGTNRLELWSTPYTNIAYSITPNSVYVVFKVTLLVDSSENLLATPTAVGGIYNIAISLPAGATIGAFGITPDSERVIYIADDDANGQSDLFSAPTTSGVTVKLNNALVTEGNVKAFKIAPNSQRVVYLADEVTDNIDELFSTLAIGGGHVRLNRDSLPINAEVDQFAISPNSQFVVYRSDQDVLFLDELFSVPLGGGPSIQLNNPLILTGDVESFKISADSNKIIYLADQEVEAKYELFTSIAGLESFLPIVLK